MKKISFVFIITTMLSCFFALSSHAGTLDSVDIYLKYSSIGQAMSSEKAAPTSIIDAGEERINTGTGGVSYYSEELSLPGAGGLDFTVGRKFNSEADKDIYGDSYYVSVKDYRDVDNPAEGEKYVFEYHTDENLSDEAIYIAFDSINDMFDAESETNTITVSAAYQAEAISLKDTNGKYKWGIESTAKNGQSSVDIGFSDSFYLYEDIIGSDIVLYRDLSKRCAILWSQYKSSSVYTKSFNYSAETELGGGWEYDIPVLLSLDYNSDSRYMYDYGLFYDAFAKETVSFYCKYTDAKLISAKCYYVSRPITNSESPSTVTNRMYTISANYSYGEECVTSYTITRNDGLKFYFEYDELLSIEDRFGNCITYDYNQPGYRIVITDTLGRKIGLDKTKLTLDGETLIEYDCAISNNSTADPYNLYTEDDSAVFTASYKVDKNNYKNIVYYHSQKGRVYQIANIAIPQTVSYCKALIDKIELPTGAERHYNYDKIKRKNYFSSYNWDWQCVERYDIQSSDAAYENDTVFEYINSDTTTPETKTTYPNRDGYEVLEHYDLDNRVTKRVTTCADLGYTQTEDYTYTFLNGNFFVSKKSVSKVGSDGKSITYTEMFSYDATTHNVTKHSRDGDTVYQASYGTYGLPSYEYEICNAGNYRGVKNIISNGVITKTNYVTLSSLSGTATTKESVKYTYDSYGNVASVDGDGKYVEYTYEYGDYSNGETPEYSIIVTETYPGVENITDSSGNIIPSANIVKKSYYDERGNLVKIVDGEGNVTAYEYDGLGRVLKVTNPDNTKQIYSYNYVKNRIYTTDEKGKRGMIAYDSLGRELALYYLNEDATAWAITYYKSYDSYGNMMGYSPYRDGTADCTTKYTYYSDNSVKTERLRNRLSGDILRENVYTYTIPEDNLQAVTVEKTKTNGETVTITNYTDPYGFKAKDTISNGVEESTQEYTVYKDGSIKYVYDLRGNRAHYYTYNYRGRVLKDTRPIGYEENIYDGAFLYQVRDGLGKIVKTYEYNSIGMLIREITPIDDEQDNVTEYYYDRNGNKTRTVTSTGTGTTTKTILTTYDNMNRPIAVGDGSGYYTRYEYDDLGNVTRMATGVSGINEAINRDIHSVTDYEYNYRDFLVEVTDPMGYAETYTYNSRGTMTSSSDKNGAVTSYTYDGAPQLLAKTVTKDGESKSINYKYDLLGNVVSMVDDVGEICYTYDMLGNVLTETRNGEVKEFTYDENGNRTGMEIDAGEVKRSIAYTYDNNNRLTKVTDENGYRSYKYNNNNQVLTETIVKNGSNPAKGYIVYTYYDGGLLKTKKNYNYSGALSSYILDDYALSYYADGNIASVNDGGKLKEYTYDNAGRLTKEVIGGEATTYTYDARGNRVGSVGSTGTTTYYYDKNNRLTEESAITNGKELSVEYAYDNNGNLLRKRKYAAEGISFGDVEYEGVALNSGENTEEFEFDLWGRMITADVNNAHICYEYDGNGIRLSKSIDGVTTSFVNDGGLVVGEVTGDSVVKYTYGINLASIDNNGVVGYYFTDWHGSVSKITDINQSVVANYDYDAFGNVTSDTASYYNPMKYCSEYYDAETGLIYLRARYYDPSIGRFITVDPVKDGLNWYVYCWNNPIAFVDPSGLESYVFYLSTNKAVAQDDKKELMRLGIPADEIIMIQVDSKEDFENGWNNMGTIQDADGNETSVEIDHIVIDMHSGPKDIGTNSDWKVSLNEIDKFESKEIKGNVVLLGCNAGHLDYKSDNVASHFAQKVNGALVIASDGTVYHRSGTTMSIGKNGIKISTPNGYLASKNDRDFARELCYDENRDNAGWIVYRYNGSAVTTRIADSGSKKLIISSACRLLY